VGVLRMLGAVLLVVLAFSLVGTVVEFLAWAVAAGALIFGGVVVWSLFSRDRARTRERVPDTRR
jgi:membrane associated rhomboid family serine protease